MKKALSFIIVITMLVALLASCAVPNDTNGQNTNTGSNESTNTSTEGACPDTSLDFATMKEKRELYTLVDAGELLIETNLGASLTSAYFHEILDYQDFCTLVEKPEALSETDFENNYVLAIKRVLSSTQADKGMMDYDPSIPSITIVGHPTGPTEDLVPKYDYILLPRSIKSSYELTGSAFGEIQTNYTYSHGFYGYAYREIELSFDTQGENAWYFEDSSEAMEFLSQRNISHYFLEDDKRFESCHILMLAINNSLRGFEERESSSFSGFKDFYTDGENVYITLGRTIVNGDYGSDKKPYLYCIAIPDSEVCYKVVSNPSVTILGIDNVLTIKNKASK